MLYALILIMTINGQSQAYAMDTGLTQADCQEALQANPGLVDAGKLYCVAEPKHKH